MRSVWQSVFLTGLLLLAGVVIVFTFQPGPLVYEGYISIDTAKSGTRDAVNIAKTKISLNDQNSLNLLPEQIGEWTTVGGRDDELLIEQMLGSDVLLMRTYRETLSSWPMFLSIVHDGSINALHPAEVCYKTAGYIIDRQEKISLTLTSAALVNRVEGYTPGTVRDWMTSKMGLDTPFKIEVNKLIVSREQNGDTVEKRLSYYVFLRNTDIFSEEYSMVSVSTLLPVEGEYQIVEDEVRNFMRHVLETVLEPVASTNARIWNLLTEQGVKGYLIIVAALSIPLFLIFYPVFQRKIFLSQNKVAAIKNTRQAENIERGNLIVDSFLDVTRLDDIGQILAAYKYSQEIVSRLTRVSVDDHLTLRDYASLVNIKLPVDISSSFMELTKIAERVKFGEILDPATTRRSLELAKQIAILASEIQS